MSTPGPRPGPAGPDLDALRNEVADLLEESAPPRSVGSWRVDTESDGGGQEPDDQSPGERVTDEQVRSLDRAHALLSEALESLDRGN